MGRFPAAAAEGRLTRSRSFMQVAFACFISAGASEPSLTFDARFSVRFVFRPTIKHFMIITIYGRVRVRSQIMDALTARPEAALGPPSSLSG